MGGPGPRTEGDDEREAASDADVPDRPVLGCAAGRRGAGERAGGDDRLPRRHRGDQLRPGRPQGAVGIPGPRRRAAAAAGARRQEVLPRAPHDQDRSSLDHGPATRRAAAGPLDVPGKDAGRAHAVRHSGRHVRRRLPAASDHRSDAPDDGRPRSELRLGRPPLPPRRAHRDHRDHYPPGMGLVGRDAADRGRRA